MIGPSRAPESPDPGRRRGAFAGFALRRACSGRACWWPRRRPPACGRRRSPACRPLVLELEAEAPVLGGPQAPRAAREQGAGGDRGSRHRRRRHRFARPAPSSSGRSAGCWPRRLPAPGPRGRRGWPAPAAWVGRRAGSEGRGQRRDADAHAHDDAAEQQQTVEGDAAKEVQRAPLPRQGDPDITIAAVHKAIKLRRASSEARGGPPPRPAGDPTEGERGFTEGAADMFLPANGLRGRPAVADPRPVRVLRGDAPRARPARAEEEGRGNRRPGGA